MHGDIAIERAVAVRRSDRHRLGRIAPADPAAPTGSAYAKSKLANLLFTYGLDRRRTNTGAAASAANPGGASTEVFRYSPAAFRLPNLAIARLFGRTPVMGRCLRSAPQRTRMRQVANTTVPQALFEIPGYPSLVRSSARSHDRVQQTAYERCPRN